MSFTPMIRQYLEIKAQCPDAILFFRLGDFYEMFFNDARTASQELEITLTGRDGGGRERIPMCGVPYHAAQSYIAKLIGKGFRVAICEQVEDPSMAKGVVRREIVRIITPGTVMEGHLLEDKRNNYLVAIAPGENSYGIAVTDITTGAFMAGSFEGEKATASLVEDLTRLAPAEIILPVSELDTCIKSLGIQEGTAPSGYRDIAFSYEQAMQAFQAQFGPDALSEAPVAVQGQVYRAAGALIAFLKETQKRDLAHIKKVQYYLPEKYMVLDAATRRNLELTRSVADGSRKNTLLSVLDYTVTAMGGRLLRNWIEQPLLTKKQIEQRLGAVGELVKNVFLHQDLKETLKNIYDMERLAGKISFGTANARDLVALRKSLAYLPGLKSMLEQADSPLLKETGRAVDPMDDIRVLLFDAIEDDPPISTRDGGIVRTGFNKEVEKYRTAGREAKTMLADLEERERVRTGIRSLKVGYNKVFGYYIEVTKSNLRLVPEEYQRKQTLANAERYITPTLKEYEDLILGATERLIHLEYRLFNEIRDQLAGEIHRMQDSAHAVARADVLYSLAEAAATGKYVRPEVNLKNRLFIKEGRHPVLERVLGPGQFVPNDTEMDHDRNRLFLITGPNMAGKSTYMRQVALIVLMAQMGSFVPASRVSTPLIDRIFTRIGASDDLAGGQSTFMVEMNECRSIIEGATINSLIIMDEVGRGTSTYDGISIARSLVEFIHQKIGAKTLFSTHYHELTGLDEIVGIVNFNVAVNEDGENIIFLRKVIPGKANRSYGIYVAKLAGLPEEIIIRSAEILESLETVKGGARRAAATGEYNGCYSSSETEKQILREIRSLDVFSMTPLEAINKLFTLQKKLKGGGL